MNFRLNTAQWVMLGLATCMAGSGLHLQRGLETDSRPITSVDRLDLHTVTLLAHPNVSSVAGQVAQVVCTMKPERTLLLGDQPMYGRRGVSILMPCELRDGKGQKIIVVRGWMDTKRALASNLAAGYASAKHQVVVTGRLENWPMPVAASLGPQGLVREGIGLADFYGPDRPDLMPIVLRETYTSDWSASDRKNHPLKMHWPDIYPHSQRDGKLARVLFVVAGLMGAAALVWTFLRPSRH